MLKRAFDVVGGTLLLVVALPVIGSLAVAVAIMFRAWPFFVQERIGLGGRRFKLIKLRTLSPSAPTEADKFEIQQLVIPRLARFLRRTHLDELPQLLLVPLGKMSLVGPRPEMVRLHEAGNAAFAEARVRVRPGCAGLWQVSTHAPLLIWGAPQYDLFYVRYASVRLDLWVLWRALLTMLGLSRPITLLDVPAWAYRSGADAADERVRALLVDQVSLGSQHGLHLMPAADTIEVA
jgi:lipopolysaccharide/colanic/teichoic acid biosynthesis glycosyltransferase